MELHLQRKAGDAIKMEAFLFVVVVGILIAMVGAVILMLADWPQH